MSIAIAIRCPRPRKRAPTARSNRRTDCTRRELTWLLDIRMIYASHQFYIVCLLTNITIKMAPRINVPKMEKVHTGQNRVEITLSASIHRRTGGASVLACKRSFLSSTRSRQQTKFHISTAPSPNTPVTNPAPLQRKNSRTRGRKNR